MGIIARQRKPLLLKQTLTSLRSRSTLSRVYKPCLFQAINRVFLDCLQPAFFRIDHFSARRKKQKFRTLHCEGKPLLFKQTLRSRLTILRVFKSCLFQTFNKVFLDCLQPAFSLKICLVLIPASEIVNNNFRIENLPWVPETFHARAFRFRPKLFSEISEGRDARI